MSTVTVIDPGFQTTIQDGGRPGYLAKGVPPSGAQDVWSFAKDWKATLGGRYEHWRAYDGLNFSLAPADRKSVV